jgi:hypothetical protein
MHRVSEISSLKEFEIEDRREALRDRRWKRHRSMLFSSIFLTATVLSLFGERLSMFSTLWRWF